jgi:CNT family concentrative nucleoside transporter
MLENLIRGIIGIILILGIAYLFSNNKKKINFKLVGYGLLIQITFAIFILKGEYLRSIFAPLGWVKDFFQWVSSFFVLILNFTTEGSKFVFGNLALPPGTEGSSGMYFAFQVLTIIIFFASLVAILYHLGIMQKIVQGMAWLVAKVLGTSGAESLSCTANIFLGQTEAPLVIKPYIEKMTNSELLTIMTGGMATIAGSVMGAYIQILGFSFAQSMGLELKEAQLLFATHLLSASIMAAPAAIIISKIIYPETGTPITRGSVKLQVEKTSANIIDAAASGASEGLKLALNVGAMLIAFIALIALVNYMLEWFGGLTGLNAVLQNEYGKPLNLQLILGLILRYVAYGIGVPWQDALNFGGLLGSKVVVNEFIAYMDMSKMIEAKEFVSEKSIIMATYALCGFANFSSIAIQIGGLTPLAPSRRSDLSKLGLRAVLGGVLATLLTATLAGIFFTGN